MFEIFEMEEPIFKGILKVDEGDHFKLKLLYEISGKNQEKEGGLVSSTENEFNEGNIVDVLHDFNNVQSPQNKNDFDLLIEKMYSSLVSKKKTMGDVAKLMRGGKRSKRRKSKKRPRRKSRIPKKYTDKLSKKDRQKQLNNINRSKKLYQKGIYVDRPKLRSYQNKKSQWILKFEKKYNHKITDKSFIHKNILKRKGQLEVIKKGKGAYYSSGSRPNQTATSWALARLASVIVGGPARKVDNSIWEKYKV